MPSLPLTAAQTAGDRSSFSGMGASALMAIDSSPLFLSPPEEHHEGNGVFMDRLEDGRRVIKRHSMARSRPRSYIQIVEDFHRGQRPPSDVILNSEDEDDFGGDHLPSTAPHSPPKAGSAFPQQPRSRRSSRVSFAQQHPRRKEDTIRKKKRFSLPALAVHTTSVTAHSSPSSHHNQGIQHQVANSSSAFPHGYKREKRFSLVLGSASAGLARSQLAGGVGAEGGEDEQGSGDLANGIAAGRLNELLTRGKATPS